MGKHHNNNVFSKIFGPQGLHGEESEPPPVVVRVDSEDILLNQKMQTTGLPHGTSIGPMTA